MEITNLLVALSGLLVIAFLVLFFFYTRAQDALRVFDENAWRGEARLKLSNGYFVIPLPNGKWYVSARQRITGIRLLSARAGFLPIVRVESGASGQELAFTIRSDFAGGIDIVFHEPVLPFLHCDAEMRCLTILFDYAYPPYGSKIVVYVGEYRALTYVPPSAAPQPK